MRKLVKKSLIAGASLLMLASVGAGTSNVSVNARHRHTYRVYRYHLTRRKGKSIKRIHKHLRHRSHKISKAVTIKRRNHGKPAKRLHHL